MSSEQINYVKIKPKTLINVSRIVTIYYFEFGPNFSNAGERHDFWEMVYIDKGSVVIGREDEEFVANQGEVIFHKPNELHSIRSLNSSPNFFVISFECNSIAMKYFERFKIKLDDKLKVFISSIVNEANKTYVIAKNNPKYKKLERKQNAPLGAEQLIKIYLEQILIFMLRAITKKGNISAVVPEDPNDKNPIVSAITAYMNERVEDVVRVSDVCNEFGYSRSFLNKMFKASTGESLAAYFTVLKIKRAKSLIRDTNLNFAQISARLSFENPQYFSRVFKRQTGMTPSEYKRRAHV